MRRFYPFIAITILCLCANPFNQDGLRERNDDYIKGANFTNYFRSGYASDSSAASLAGLADAGAGWVAVVKTYYQDNVTSSAITEDVTKTPSDAAITAIVTEARSLGLNVFMVPHVDVRTGAWRGDIAPADADQWFGYYVSRVTEFARLAASLNADLFSVGCEFKALSTGSQWGRVIDSVKNHYTGPLTYCANWNEYRDVPFWDRLDYVGVDWYVPLGVDEETSFETAHTNLEVFVEELGHWAGDRQMLLTEVGFPSLATATVEPWSSPAGGTADWAVQAACYRNVLETFPHRSWFAGLFWWEWEAEPYAAEYDVNFNPAGKGAEEVLRGFWQ